MTTVSLFQGTQSLGAELRQIELNGQCVDYTLQRGRRRTIGFTVDDHGLSVCVPRWIGSDNIETALREKACWILRKLSEQQARCKRLESAKIIWAHGAQIPYLGQPLTLICEPETSVHLQGQQLHLCVHAEPLAQQAQAWFKRQALHIFEQRVHHFANALGVRPHCLRLSSARTRWGSASACGVIRLNWRLVHFSLATLDYVVAHELAHLIEMNHSPAFWTLVRSVVPHYERAQAVLKDTVLPVF